MVGFEILKWDSAFFGFGVARILPRRLSSLALAKVLNELRDKKVALVYWASDPEDAATQAAASGMGGFLADEKVTYVIEGDRAVHASMVSRRPVEPYTEGWPNCALEKLALQSSIYSRFRVDPRIPVKKFKELYLTWIRESVTKTLADAVLVQRNREQIVGMVTVGTMAERGDIGLIAVDESARGQGVGESLVHAAIKWSLDHGFPVAQVVTQGANTAACRLYEKCGYRAEKVDHVYHFWL